MLIKINDNIPVKDSDPLSAGQISLIDVTWDEFFIMQAALILYDATVPGHNLMSKKIVNNLLDGMEFACEKSLGKIIPG